MCFSGCVTVVAKERTLEKIWVGYECPKIDASAKAFLLGKYFFSLDASTTSTSLQHKLNNNSTVTLVTDNMVAYRQTRSSSIHWGCDSLGTSPLLRIRWKSRAWAAQLANLESHVLFSFICSVLCRPRLLFSHCKISSNKIPSYAFPSTNAIQLTQCKHTHHSCNSSRGVVYKYIDMPPSITKLEPVI